MCSDTPRFSYTGPKTRVSTVGHCSNGHVRARRCGQDGYTGWVQGGVYRVGNTGSPSEVESGGMYSEAGPGSPGTGLEWVVHAAAPTPAPVPTPAGPGRPAASLVQDPPHMPLLANKGEI